MFWYGRKENSPKLFYYIRLLANMEPVDFMVISVVKDEKL